MTNKDTRRHYPCKFDEETMQNIEIIKKNITLPRHPKTNKPIVGGINFIICTALQTVAELIQENATFKDELKIPKNYRGLKGKIDSTTDIHSSNE